MPPLLLTRPATSSARFATLWQKTMGAQSPVIIAPVTKIIPLEHKAPMGVAIFTSSNAVACVQQDGRLSHAWCVGARTAEAASVKGYQTRVASGTADDLVEAILASKDPGPFIHFRGREAHGSVTKRLQSNGLTCVEIVVYDQKPVPLSNEALTLLSRSGPVLLPLFSPRSAERLSDALRDQTIKADLYVAVLSSQVAQTWRFPSTKSMQSAQSPNAEAMIETLLELKEMAALP